MSGIIPWRCMRNVIVHEVGHAIGLYHEHNRADRDRYIKIHFENIEDGKLSEFEKWPEDHYDDFNKPYDYKSIMHYGELFFSKNESQKLITVETLRPEFQDIIGKAKHPSFLDYKIVNLLYQCSDACGNVQCPAGGYLGKNCRCYCEGAEEHTPVTLCYQEKNCPKPVINQYLFESHDKIDEAVVDLSYDSYPDETIINVFSTNLNCSLNSEVRCDNGIWIGQLPDCPVDLGLELSGGSDDEGIIEVILNGQYGTICDDNWDDNDATVACRMMGFEFGKIRREHSFRINESLPILMDDLKCSGEETSLSECSHSGWGNHDCDITESAAVECFDTRNTAQSKDTDKRGTCGTIPLELLRRRKREVRVAGGTEALRGMHPWQVGIQRKRMRWAHWCGGTIIDKYWILTAAHCLDDVTRKRHGKSAKMNYDDFRIIIGDHDRTERESSEQSFRIEYWVKHWKYTETDGLYTEFDIALIKIHPESGDGVIFNDYVQPACIPEENDQVEAGIKCEVSGWGKQSESGANSVKLNSVEVSIVKDEDCEELYKQYPIDTNRMVCAGDVTDRTGVDTCQGDSGGPLICNINDRKTVLGITSWGEGCGRPDAPGVYTRVSGFVNWIKDQIQLHDDVGVVPDGIKVARFVPLFKTNDRASVGCTLSSDQRFIYYNKADDLEKQPGSTIQNGTTLIVSCAVLDMYAFDSDEYYELDYSDSSLYSYYEIPEHTIRCIGDTLTQTELNCPEVTTATTDSCMTLQNGSVKKEYGYFIVSCDKGYSLNLIIPEKPQCTCVNGKLRSDFGNQEPVCKPDDCVVPYGIDERLSVINTIGVSLSGGSVVKIRDVVNLNCSKAPKPTYEPSNRKFRCINGLWIEAEIDKNWVFGTNGKFPTCREAICNPSCNNGGVCFKDDTCRCSEYTKGGRCEEVICDEKCLRNGGTCLEPGRCTCPKGRLGTNCEKEECILPDNAAKNKNRRTVFSPGEKLTTFLCDTGYIASPGNGMTCLDDGSWSEIVMCEKAAHYLISVKTADRYGDGTDANVYITLHGNSGRTHRIFLRGTFGRNDLDETRVKAMDIRPIRSIVIGHDGNNLFQGWNFEYVSIYVENMEEYYVFRERSGPVFVTEDKDVVLTSEDEHKQCINTFDKGHKWYPMFDLIRNSIIYLSRRRRVMSLRGCKQECVNLEDNLCQAVNYNTKTRTCYGITLRGRQSFARHGVWEYPVYIRICEPFN